MNIAELYERAKGEVGLEDTGPVPYIVSTGSVLIDKATGIGGFPGGRIIEMFGPESSGKTTLATSVLANAQKMELPIAVIDVEHTFDEKYAKNIGITGERNVDWFYGAPDTTEQTINLLEVLIEEGVKVIMIDSVASMVPEAEAQGEYGEATMGLQARLMSSAMRRLKGPIESNGAMVIFTNQLRMKLGVQFGSPETTTGGEALKYYSSMRVDIRAVGEKITSQKEVIGQFRRVTIKKNKLAPPLKVVMVPIKFGVGVWKGAELLDELLSCRIVTKSSSHFHHDGESIGNGKANAILHIEEELEYFKEMLKHAKSEDSES